MDTVIESNKNEKNVLESPQEAKEQGKKSTRMIELDFFRGLSIVLMILHHFVADIRHIFGIDLFAWEESFVFRNVIRAPFLFIFLFVSGICCNFSSNNLKRFFKYITFSASLSLIFLIINKLIVDIDMYIITNIIFVIAIGTLICYIFQKLTLGYKKNPDSSPNTNKIPIDSTGKTEVKEVDPSKYYWGLGIVTGLIFLVWALLFLLDTRVNIWLSIFHSRFKAGIGIADHLHLLPWLGYFLLGAILGKAYYSKHGSIFEGLPKGFIRAIRPFVYVGKNSLWFYILHQPVLAIIIYVLISLKII